MMNLPRKNENQFTKILMFKLDEDEEWEEVDGAYRRLAFHVYRRPQAQWDLIDDADPQWVWYVPQAMGFDNSEGAELSEWIRCYWDSQAGRWVVLSNGMTLCRFALTESLTSGIANATIKNMLGTTVMTSKIRDPEGIFSELESGDTGLAIEQGGKFYIIQAPCGD